MNIFFLISILIFQYTSSSPSICSSCSNEFDSSTNTICITPVYVYNSLISPFESILKYIYEYNTINQDEVYHVYMKKGVYEVNSRVGIDGYQFWNNVTDEILLKIESCDDDDDDDEGGGVEIRMDCGSNNNRMMRIRNSRGIEFKGLVFQTCQVMNISSGEEFKTRGIVEIDEMSSNILFTNVRFENYYLGSDPSPLIYIHDEVDMIEFNECVFINKVDENDNGDDTFMYLMDIPIGGEYRVSIIGCEFLNFDHVSIFIENSCQVLIDSNYFTPRTDSSMYILRSIDVYDNSKYIFINNNIFDINVNNRRSNIVLRQSHVSCYLEFVFIQNNYFNCLENVDLHTIELFRGAPAYKTMRNIRIHNNYFSKGCFGGEDLVRFTSATMHQNVEISYNLFEDITLREDAIADHLLPHDVKMENNTYSEYYLLFGKSERPIPYFHPLNLSKGKTFPFSPLKDFIGVDRNEEISIGPFEDTYKKPPKDYKLIIIIVSVAVGVLLLFMFCIAFVIVIFKCFKNRKKDNFSRLQEGGKSYKKDEMLEILQQDDDIEAKKVMGRLNINEKFFEIKYSEIRLKKKIGKGL